MMKKIKELNLAQVLYFEDKNRKMIDSIPMLQRAIEGMHGLIKIYGYQTAAAVWKQTMPELPEGLINLPYIIDFEDVKEDVC